MSTRTAGPARSPFAGTEVYDVLYAVNGVVSSTGVTVGPCDGRPYTTVDDIDRIIGLALGVAPANVEVRSVRKRP